MADTGKTRTRPTLAPALLVFAAGACLMCVEIIGGMTIAPYFGSNVYVWGSVITVFMGALSLGYYLGGRVADRRRSAMFPAALATGAGVLVALVPVFGGAACRAILAVDLGQTLNPLLPLVAAVVLFFLPSVLFGMILPVAVRAVSTAVASVGRSVGRLYALNALGSVAGALLGTFVFAAHFGNRAILIGCGIVMVLAAFGYVSLIRRTGINRLVSPREKVTPSLSSPAGEGRRVAGLVPLVFVCGMVFMSFQIIGGAVIAPYLGSSIFVWGSVITIFLVALSVGYRVGGRLADRRPTMMTVATLVVAAGIAILLVPLIASGTCSLVLRLLPGSTLRALLTAAALYAVPTVLLAMVAPFAVRMATERVDAVGGVAGRLYALSTLGNVAGALLTTFVLIRLIGKTHLLEAAGVLTVLVAVVAVFLNNRAAGEKRQPVLVSALLLAAVVALALLPKPPLVPLAGKDQRVVGTVASPTGSWCVIAATYFNPVANEREAYHFLRRIREERESPYHHLAAIEQAVINTNVLGHDVLRDRQLTTEDGRTLSVVPTTDYGNRRDLRFDQYIESSVVLDDEAKEIRVPYTSGTTYSDLLHLPFIFQSEARDILIVGGGGGVVPMIFRDAYDVVIDIVEIDPVVVEMAKKWFGLRLDGRVRMHIQDGRMFIHNSTKKYDIILLDAYTAGGRIPFHLTTREFLAEVRDRLKPDGVALMNVISAVEGPLSKLFRAEYKTFKDVFGVGSVYIFPKGYPGWERTRSTNVMLVATGPAHTQQLRKEEVVARARRLTEANKIRMGTIPKYAAYMLTRGELDQLPQDDVPVLRDDYAPVDMWVAEQDGE